MSPNPRNNLASALPTNRRRRRQAPALLLFPLHGILKLFKSLASSLLLPCPPAIASELRQPSGWDPHGHRPNMTIGLNKLSGLKKYKFSNINFLHHVTRAPVPGALEAFRDVVGLRPGGCYTKTELSQLLQQLSSNMCFRKIDFDVSTNPDGTLDLNVPYKEKSFSHKSRLKCASVGMLPPEVLTEEEEQDPQQLTQKERARLAQMLHRRQASRLKYAGDCILPEQVREEIEWTMSQSYPLRASTMIKVVGQIQKWYHDNGYKGARVGNIVGLDGNYGGEVVVEVNEGELKKLAIRFKDVLGNTCEGNTDIRIIKRALPEGVAVGNPFNERVFQEAVYKLHSLSIFSKIDMVPHEDQISGDLSIDIELQEQSPMWSDVQTNWNVAPGRWGLPALDLLQPGATIQFGHRNIKGLKRELEGKITLANLFDPRDDVDFNFEYTHPHIDGIDDPRERKFQAACFSTRKFSPAFTSKSGVEAPSILVDRRGIKATITQDYTRQSKFTYGLVVEDVKTHGEEGNIAFSGHRMSLVGQLGRGPPTTLSGTGNDRLAFLQANLTRDTTRFVNGALVGARDVFQVDQGTGIGSKFAFFNRFKLSATRFIPLMKVKEGKGNPAPPTLVLHGLYANCIGDLPNHEAFPIGGPHSVRGYSVGEIGVSRSKLEVAAEVRVPVKNSFVYAFAEHGNDLGSSAAVVGNPTKSYLRQGYGTSYGVGVKYGQTRAEYAVDHNSNRGTFFVHYGDRF